MQATDGRFTIPALPGRGLITARAPEGAYLHGLGADAIKGFDGRMGAFQTYPFNCDTIDKHVFVEINPAPGTKEMTVDLQVDPGRTVQGTIVGPDDRPVIGGVEIQTLDVFQGPQQTPWFTSTFEVKGLPTGADRVDFLHAGRKLAGSLRLKGDETGKLTVKLQPWGTVVGRIVDEDGKPSNQRGAVHPAAGSIQPRVRLDQRPVHGGRPGPVPHRRARPGLEVRRQRLLVQPG